MLNNNAVSINIASATETLLTVIYEQSTSWRWNKARTPTPQQNPQDRKSSSQFYKLLMPGCRSADGCLATRRFPLHHPHNSHPLSWPGVRDEALSTAARWSLLTSRQHPSSPITNRDWTLFHRQSDHPVSNRKKKFLFNRILPVRCSCSELRQVDDNNSWYRLFLFIVLSVHTF